MLEASNTILTTFAPQLEIAVAISEFIGDPNFALTAAALASADTFWRFPDIDTDTFSEELVTAIKYGEHYCDHLRWWCVRGMLAAAQVGAFVADLLAGIGIPLIVAAWLVACMVRIAQGSGTVALLTAAGMMAPLVGDAGNHPVFLMKAIGFGAVIFSWYNDRGYWIVFEMGGMTQIETYKTWTAMTTIMAFVGLITAWVFSLLIPLWFKSEYSFSCPYA